jgi:predicted GIY-YIG superfamily endonuclease
MKKHTVYAIINPIENNVFYVGESTNFKTRKWQHNTISNRIFNDEKEKIVKSIFSAGLKPTFLILDYDIETKEDAVKIESFYIKKYRELGHPITNKNDGGNNPPIQNKKRTDAQKRKSFDCSVLRKKVKQFDKKGNFIAEYEGVREAYRITKIDHRSIAQVAGGSKIRKSAGGYLWQY